MATTRSLPQLKDYPTPSVCSKLSIILHLDYSVLGLVVADKKKKKVITGKDLNSEQGTVFIHLRRPNSFRAVSRVV